MDRATVVAAAERFVRACTSAIRGEDPLPLTDPAVIEAHQAARELIGATGTTDLVGAYAVVDELVVLTS
jgi:hypothetical protein